MATKFLSRFVNLVCVSDYQAFNVEVEVLYYSSDKYNKHRVYVNGDKDLSVDGYCLICKTDSEALAAFNKLLRKGSITACELFDMGFLTYQQLNQKGNEDI